MSNYESTSDLSLVIDPGGTGDRPGINLRVYPTGDQPLEYSNDNDTLKRTTNRELAIGGYDDLQEFTFDVVLDTVPFTQLQGLINWSQQQKSLRSDWEIVLYNLAEPYSEISLSRTRYRVPATPSIAEEELGGGYTQYTYWIALQGSLQIVSKRQAGSMWQLRLKFSEGTKLTSAME